MLKFNRKIKILLTTSIFLFFCNSAFSQTIKIQGTIAESANKTPIPFAHVLLKSQNQTIKGVVGDESGSYSILLNNDSVSLNDSLYFSCIGYVGFAVSVKNLKTSQILEIQLEPAVYQMAEFVVKPNDFKRKTKSLGYNRWNRCFGKYFFGYGYEVALYFPNKDTLKGIISEARFFVKKDGFPDTKFRVNVYNTNANGSPGQPILNESVIVSSTKGNQWVVVDLSKYQLEIPKNGFFIAMEWLPDSKNKVYWKGNNNENSDGQVLGGVSIDIDDPSYGWARPLGGNWIKYTHEKYRIFQGNKQEVSNFIEPAIGATLKLYK